MLNFVFTWNEKKITNENKQDNVQCIKIENRYF